MSIGNLNTHGQKKSNYPYQLKNLQALKKISDLLTIQGNDFESQLVLDAAGNVYLEIRLWDPTATPPAFNNPVYYPAGSNTPVLPTLPVTYITPEIPQSIGVSTLRPAAGDAEETGTISAARSISIANTGTADAEVDGTVLKAGEVVTFDAGLNNTLMDLEYDCSATGAELLIIFTGGSITNP